MTSTNVDQFILFSRQASLGFLLWSCQSALLLGVAWAVLQLDRSRSPSTRCRIWLMALVMVAILPFLNRLAPRLHFWANSVTRLPLERIAPAAVPAAIPLTAPEFRWPSLIWPLLFAIWIAGVVAALWRLFRSHWELHRIRSRARPASAAELDSLGLPESGSKLNGARIGLSDELHSPGMVGVFHPWILFPSDIVAWTTLEERTSILHHELAHIHRRDHLAVLFQQALRTILFFHPLLRHACTQLDIERELACDDHVLDRGAERRVYAESILKVAQRCLPGPRLQPANPFASKCNLERRIDMILDSNRIKPSRQWLFLVPPAALLLAITWLVVPASGQRPASTQTASNNGPHAPEVKTVAQSGSVPVVDKSTIWTDVVKRGGMTLGVRGLGVLVAGRDGRLHAEIQLPSSQARDLAVGEPADIAVREATRTVNGKVTAIHRDAGSEMVVADVSLDTALPQGAEAGVRTDGIIHLGILFSVLQVNLPVAGAPYSTGEVFRLDEDGQSATRVRVSFGMSTVQTIQIVEGLKAGDRIILSNMEKFAGIDRIRLQ